MENYLWLLYIYIYIIYIARFSFRCYFINDARSLFNFNFLNDATCAYFVFPFLSFVRSFYLSFSEPCPCYFTRWFLSIFKRSSLPNHGDELRVLLEVSLLHFLRSTTADYSSIFCYMQPARCTTISRTCNTWSFNVSAKRKRKKKRGTKKIAEHTLRVSLLHSHRPTLYYPLSLYLLALPFFFLFHGASSLD